MVLSMGNLIKNIDIGCFNRKRIIIDAGYTHNKLFSFAILLGTFLNRTVEVDKLQFHLRDFKELLLENNYQVTIDPRKEGKLRIYIALYK